MHPMGASISTACHAYSSQYRWPRDVACSSFDAGVARVSLGITAPPQSLLGLALRETLKVVAEKIWSCVPSVHTSIRKGRSTEHSDRSNGPVVVAKIRGKNARKVESLLASPTQPLREEQMLDGRPLQMQRLAKGAGDARLPRRSRFHGPGGGERGILEGAAGKAARVPMGAFRTWQGSRESR